MSDTRNGLSLKRGGKPDDFLDLFAWFLYGFPFVMFLTNIGLLPFVARSVKNKSQEVGKIARTMLFEGDYGFQYSRLPVFCPISDTVKLAAVAESSNHVCFDRRSGLDWVKSGATIG